MSTIEISAGPGIRMGLFTNQEDFVAAVRQLPCPDDPGPFVTEDAGATTHTLKPAGGGQPVFFVGIRPEFVAGCTGIEIAALLVHESVHVWQGYADSLAEHEPGSEHEAYSIQFISQTLMEMFLASDLGHARFNPDAPPKRRGRGGSKSSAG